MTTTPAAPPAIAPDDPRSPDVHALLTRHLELMHAQSDPEDVHALDVDALTAPLADYEGGQRTFGQAYEYGNGLFVQIKAPVEFEPTEQTVGLGGEGVPVKIRVSITNGSRTDYKPHTLSATAVSGGVEATPLTDATAQIEVTGPSVEVRPAGVVAFDLAFLVADPSDVTLTVIPAIGGYQPVVYSTP